MQAFFLLILIPIILLNFLGGIIGGTWLALRGEWALVGFGILYMIAAPFLLSLALLPGMAVGVPAVMTMRRHPFVGLALGIPSMVWTFAVIAVSCVWSFTAAAAHLSESPIPHMMWGYAIALAPWMYMANKERRSGTQDGTTVPIFFAQLGTLSMAAAAMINPGDTSFVRLFAWFVPFTILGILLQLLMAAVEAATQRARY
jgi:hypothetical protein